MCTHCAHVGSGLGGEREVGSGEQLAGMPGAGVVLVLGRKPEIRHLSLLSIRLHSWGPLTSQCPAALSSKLCFLYLDPLG